MNNAVATPAQSTNIHFNETQWLFLLADTQSWLQQLQEGLIWQLPVKHRWRDHHRLPGLYRQGMAYRHRGEERKAPVWSDKGQRLPPT